MESPSQSQQKSTNNSKYICPYSVVNFGHGYCVGRNAGCNEKIHLKTDEEREEYIQKCNEIRCKHGINCSYKETTCFYNHELKTPKKTNKDLQSNTKFDLKLTEFPDLKKSEKHETTSTVVTIPVKGVPAQTHSRKQKIDWDDVSDDIVMEEEIKQAKLKVEELERKKRNAILLKKAQKELEAAKKFVEASQKALEQAQKKQQEIELQISQLSIE